MMNSLYVICRKTKSGAVEVYKPGDDGKSAYLWCTYDKHATKPDYRNKYVILNCYRYSIMWDR